MTIKTAGILQEALAVIGLGLFAFGVWQIFPPLCFILVGITLAAPFVFSLVAK
jgi:hypothetical protein